MTNARYIRFDINSSHDANVTSIGEVAFGTGTIVIPEPSIHVLLSFELVGLAIFRRKTAKIPERPIKVLA